MVCKVVRRSLFTFECQEDQGRWNGGGRAGSADPPALWLGGQGGRKMPLFCTKKKKKTKKEKRRNKKKMKKEEKKKPFPMGLSIVVVKTGSF